jgi:DNA repair exonuclease SbcCD ATPase subunit
MSLEGEIRYLKEKRRKAAQYVTATEDTVKKLKNNLEESVKTRKVLLKQLTHLRKKAKIVSGDEWKQILNDLAVLHGIMIDCQIDIQDQNLEADTARLALEVIDAELQEKEERYKNNGKLLPFKNAT